MRVFEQAAFVAFLDPTGSRAHYTGQQPHASIHYHHRGNLAAGQYIVTNRHFLDGPTLKDAFVKTLETAAQDDGAGAVCQLAHAGLGEGFPRGVIASTGRPSATASMAALSTSTFSTMPKPPPAGVSSTVRCLSIAKSRMLTALQAQVPCASARPARLWPRWPGNISG